MKIKFAISMFICSLLLIGCGGKTEKKEEGFSVERTKTTEKVEQEAPETDQVPASQRITLDNKGVGQIKEITLDPEIDQAMVDTGAALFKTNCTACHKPTNDLLVQKCKASCSVEAQNGS